MTMTIKGKRTKRPRPTSPSHPITSAALAAVSAASSASNTTTSTPLHHHEPDQLLLPHVSPAVTAPTTSSTATNSADCAQVSSRSSVSAVTEEEEDMANCLILLAQGTASSSSPIHRNNKAQKLSRTQQQIPLILLQQETQPLLPSFANTKSTPAAEPSVNYECKTCNRCFPSFQALGGHRASHKKPKAVAAAAAAVAEEEEKKLLLLTGTPTGLSLSSNNDQQEHQRHITTTTTTSSSSFQLLTDHHDMRNTMTRGSSSTTLSLQIGSCVTPNTAATKPSKVHECTICGAEFSSGQALGGHMRRHRPLNPTGTVATSSAVPAAQQTSPTRSNLLCLDLNLPATDSTDEEIISQQQESQHPKFVFSSNDKTLVFSGTASLVDCHY